MKFSVLICIYERDNSVHLFEALESILNQSLLPNEIVIVKDGCLTKDLEEVITRFFVRYSSHECCIKTISLERNEGLANALNKGLEFCSFELVARMDADDIAHPLRFEKQTEFFRIRNDCVALGGQIEEFNSTPGDLKRFRNLPLYHKELVQFSRFRSPLNHPTVMFRKHAIEQVGKYKSFPVSVEDYYLWLKLIHAGFKIENLPDVLLYYRVGNGMLNRRSGIKYFKGEYVFFKQIRKDKLLSNFNLLLFLVFRLPLRLFPLPVLSLLYKRFLRKI